MSFREALAALRRNMGVIALMLALTGAATAYVWQAVPVTYESHSTMIVLLPRQSLNDTPDPAPVNPYLSVGALSTQVAASALANVSSSDEFLAALQQAGVQSETSVAVAAYGGGVILELSAVDPNGAAASEDVARLGKQLSAELELRQQEAGAPEGTLITVTDLTAPSAGRPLTSNRTKLTGVAAAIGLVVTAAVVVVIEGARHQRRVRRAAPATSDAEGPTTSPPPLRDVDAAAGTVPPLPRELVGTGRSARTGELAGEHGNSTV